MSFTDILRDLVGLTRREAQRVLDTQKEPLCAAVDRAVAQLRQQVGNYATGDTVRRYVRSEIVRQLAPIPMSAPARTLVIGLLTGYIESDSLLLPAQDYATSAILAAAEKWKTAIRGAQL